MATDLIADTIALVALVISLILAAIKIQSTYFAKPSFSLSVGLMRHEVGKIQDSFIVAHVFSYDATARECQAFIKIEGVTENYEKMLWQTGKILELPWLFLPIVNIRADENAVLVLAGTFAHTADNPFFFWTADSKAPGYPLNFGKEYDVVLVIKYGKEKKSVGWTFRVGMKSKASLFFSDLREVSVKNPPEIKD